MIVDRNLPMLDGARFLESIRTDSRHRRTPLVLLNAEEEQDERGLDFSLGKPLKLRALIDVMKRVLSELPAEPAAAPLSDA